MFFFSIDLPANRGYHTYLDHFLLSSNNFCYTLGLTLNTRFFIQWVKKHEDANIRIDFRIGPKSLAITFVFYIQSNEHEPKEEPELEISSETFKLLVKITAGVVKAHFHVQLPIKDSLPKEQSLRLGCKVFRFLLNEISSLLAYHCALTSFSLQEEQRENISYRESGFGIEDF